MKIEITVNAIIAVVVILFFVWFSLPYRTTSNASLANDESVQSVMHTRSIPVITDSLDWDSAAKRAEFLSQKDRVGWLYIFTAEGVLMREEPILGKLTETNTYITPMEIVDRTRTSSDDPWTYFTYEMSDLDGTYGVNAKGVFWFDPDGNYNELPLTSPIVLYSSERKSYDTLPIFSSSSKNSISSK